MPGERQFHVRQVNQARGDLCVIADDLGISESISWRESAQQRSSLCGWNSSPADGGVRDQATPSHQRGRPQTTLAS
ncbi:MAG TPA: hypothetical protein VHT52_06820 [Stellaceae bacterium]|nr:hypothetical protein [Stellaceae bacterium]